MALLENALRASGGVDLWRVTRRFTLHMSITGALCIEKSNTSQLKDLVVEGSTHIQALDITGFACPEGRARYRPDLVTVEGPNGRIRSQQATPAEFRSGLRSALWNDIQLAHYCGYLIWNHIASPFIFTDPDFETKELRWRGEPAENLRRLRVAFPARVVTHAPSQTFYFDREGLLRRLDYKAGHADHLYIAQMFSGHQRFSGILVPTLCRLLTAGSDEVPIAKTPLLDLEIFDAKFE